CNKISIVPVACLTAEGRLGVIVGSTHLYRRFNSTLGSEKTAHRARADITPIPIIDNQNETVGKTWLNNKNSVLMVGLGMRAIEKKDIELAKRMIINLSESSLNQMERGLGRSGFVNVSQKLLLGA